MRKKVPFTLLNGGVELDSWDMAHSKPSVRAGTFLEVGILRWTVK
jgi:hypothetical protein